jgi:hypothetical protein
LNDGAEAAVAAPFFYFAFCSRKKDMMSDLLSVGATILLFAVSVIYAKACDGITKGRNHA